MIKSGVTRTAAYAFLLLTVMVFEATAQTRGPDVRLDMGPSIPVGRDAGFDFRGRGFGGEITVSYDVSRLISLKSGAHASVAPFDEQYHRRSYDFLLETPDQISARSSYFMGAFLGTEVTAIRTGGFAFHFGGEVGYGLLEMPPVDYRLNGSTLAVERHAVHGLTLGGSAGFTVRLIDGVGFRIEAATRTMRFSGETVGELPVARRGSVQEATFRIGIARSF